MLSEITGLFLMHSSYLYLLTSQFFFSIVEKKKKRLAKLEAEG